MGRMTMPTTNHTIALYPALVNRLTVRGWQLVAAEYPGYNVLVYSKQHGNYTHFVDVDYTNHRATFSRYQRITSSQQETNQ